MVMKTWTVLELILDLYALDSEQNVSRMMV